MTLIIWDVTPALKKEGIMRNRTLKWTAWQTSQGVSFTLQTAGWMKVMLFSKSAGPATTSQSKLITLAY